MNKFIFSVCILSFVFAKSQIPNFQWAKNIGGPSDDYGSSIIVDGVGNVFTTGLFASACDFDPGPGTFTLNAGGSTDVFISKLDGSGNFLWAKQFVGNLNNYSKQIVLDASGNIYTTGYFSGTTDFDPGIATYNLTSTGQSDVFVSKLDANGNFLWAIKMGGFLSEYAYSLDVDATGNVYTTGTFLGTADFNPGTGIFNLTPMGINDVFISKLDASGNFVWAKQIGSDAVNCGYSIFLDSFGDVYTTGQFENTADFDPGAGTYTLSTMSFQKDVFISKLSSSGNFIWAKQMGPSSGTSYGYSIFLDASNNIFITGVFDGVRDFDPSAGTFTLSSSGFDDIFISKLDASGNFVWAKSMGGVADDKGASIFVDLSGNVFTTGQFQGTADFDPGPGTFTFSSVSGNDDIFISELDASGNFIWAGQMGSTAMDFGSSIFIDPPGNIYSTGYFRYAQDFDPGVGVFNLNPVNSFADCYIHKMSQGSSGILNVDFHDQKSVYPNPTSGLINFNLLISTRVTINDILGREILNEKFDKGKQILDIQNQPSGIYFVKLIQENKQEVIKLIKE